jgi:hypothetical protein
MMTLDEVLNQWIRYRLQAIETLQFAWEWVGESEQQRQVDIVVDGRSKLRGNVALIANPMIEIGLVHARALLEFLGLGIAKGWKTDARREAQAVRHCDRSVHYGCGSDCDRYVQRSTVCLSWASGRSGGCTSCNF